MFSADSSVDVKLTTGTVDEFGIGADDMDHDFMYYNVTRCAFPWTQCVPASYKGQVLRIYPGDHAHPGYARLLDEESNTVFDNRELLSIHIDDTIIHGPAGQIRQRKQH